MVHLSWPITHGNDMMAGCVLRSEILTNSWWRLPRRLEWWRSLLYGLIITLGQTLFVCSHSGCPNLPEAFVHLYQFDSFWYGAIATEGYRSRVPPDIKDPKQNNVAFFPGYPLLVRLVQLGLGIDVKFAALFAALLACWGFWTYLLLFLARWQVSRAITFAALAVLLAHPAAFFLVAAFSESLFLMALLGFLYWSTEQDSWLLAAKHGFLMTATRIVGLPLSVAPLLQLLTYSSERRRQKIISLFLLAGVASLGGILFFTFCAGEYGAWDLYMQTQRNCFRVAPDYLAVFRPSSYRVFLPEPFEELVHPNDLSRLAVSFTIALFGVLLLREIWVACTYPDSGWRQRLAFYWCAWFLFAIPVCGVASVGMSSMVRYALCVHVMQVLAAVHLFSRRPLKDLAAGLAWILLFWGVCNSLLLQSWLAYRFTHSKWVA